MDFMGKIVLILGGVRSGKSRFARDLAEQIAGHDVLFVATAEAGDEEMRRRIEEHRQSRPARWITREQPLNVGDMLARSRTSHKVVLVDCLTLLVSNVILNCPDPLDVEEAEDQVRAELLSLICACGERDATVIIVSGEVGQGVVPDHPLGRIFRDLLGMANQTIGLNAAAVYLMVAGLPIEVRSRASTLEQAAAVCHDNVVARSSKRKQPQRKRSK
jgi:adenosylcobinamide kinase/adenosylcobinamide-phosphate guanylyltransferase